MNGYEEDLNKVMQELIIFLDSKNGKSIFIIMDGIFGEEVRDFINKEYPNATPMKFQDGLLIEAKIQFSRFEVMRAKTCSEELFKMGCSLGNMRINTTKNKTELIINMVN